ncbi:MAG: hypothetical protein QY309_16430 [Cyclobacteriaceae bacterium]|nr:MAG: hypothetical protein QY309_16430 [Cyclobacteriaceae bacterium]
MQLFTIVGCVLLLGLAGCKIDRETAIDRSRFTFNITPDSHLFFKNVRQLYYDVEDLPEAKWRVYRFSDRHIKSPAIHPTIVIDWAKEESYLLLESDEQLANESIFQVYEYDPQTGRKYAYQLAERGKENMLEFATKLYEGIMAGHAFTVLVNGKEESILLDEEDRENFRIVMADYYRLIRVIR